MDSGCKQRCEHNEFLYEFSKDKASFDQATERCNILNEGSLASDIDNDTYETINRCCSFASGVNYYIGLDGRTKQCKQKQNPYRWVKSGSCTDGDILNISPRRKTQCVTIAKQNSEFPRGQVSKCNDEQLYICQTKLRSSATPTIRSVKITTHEPTEMTSDETNLFSSSAIDVALNSVSLSGALIGVIVLILWLALILLCFFLYKKSFFKRFQTNKELLTLSNNELKQSQTNPIYEG